MPTFGNTPEALLGRSDSKNPATTCKGITSSGRACRRALASPKIGPPGQKRSSLPVGNGIVDWNSEDRGSGDPAFYCWQHKDQAAIRPENANRPDLRSRRTTTQGVPTALHALQERTSIDTLFQSLGLEDSVNPKPGKTPTLRPTLAQNPDRNDARRPEKKPASGPRRRPQSKSEFWASLCCFVADDDDYMEIVRHRKRVNQTRPAQTANTSFQPQNIPPLRPECSSGHTMNRKPISQSQFRSETDRLVSLLPSHLSPGTTSLLLAELHKPISPTDEDGYIYIFWLTPQNSRAPAEETARSLLSPSRPQHERKLSDVMTEFSFDGSEPHTAGRKTIMLKIGRANNVTRRMNEWQRQCGYALNLVRWYPHVASSTAPSPSPSPNKHHNTTPFYPDLNSSNRSRRQSEAVRKVAFIRRVERLIHLELAGQQVKRQCRACGKEHREWSEVEASQAGIRAVDECIKRWVGWAESQADAA